MMRLTKKKKVWINSIFLLICLALTLYYVFHGEDLERLLDYIEEAEASYWIPGEMCIRDSPRSDRWV